MRDLLFGTKDPIESTVRIIGSEAQHIMTKASHITLNFEDLFHCLGTAYLVFEVNDPEFTIIEQNRAHADIAMVEREKVIGRPLFEALLDTSKEYSSEDKTKLIESIRRVIKTETPDTVSDLSFTLKDKMGMEKTIFLEVVHYPIIEKGVLKAICQQTNDVTRRHRLESQRVQHYIDVNRTKDEFISLASHQLRTPATGVKQYLGMVLEGMAGEVTDAQQALLQKAHESNERQLMIVSDLLKVAKIDSGKVRLEWRDVNIIELLTDVIKEQQGTFAERNQTLVFLPPSQSAVAVVDPDKMRMVFENIIDNASKYSEKGGEIQVSLTETDDTIAVSISDDGVGIARNDIPKLFEKFNRVHNSLSNRVGGSGLGLYWAERVVDLHGGTIKVVSEVGKGSTFTVHLPKN